MATMAAKHLTANSTTSVQPMAMKQKSLAADLLMEIFQRHSANPD